MNLNKEFVKTKCHFVLVKWHFDISEMAFHCNEMPFRLDKIKIKVRLFLILMWRKPYFAFVNIEIKNKNRD